jgi:hypothetical protein
MKLYELIDELLVLQENLKGTETPNPDVVNFNFQKLEWNIINRPNIGILYYGNIFSVDEQQMIENNIGIYSTRKVIYL